MELLAKIVKGFKLLAVLTKNSTLDVCIVSKYTSKYKIVKNTLKNLKQLQVFNESCLDIFSENL